MQLLINPFAGSGLQPEPYNSIPASAHKKYSGSSYKLEPAGEEEHVLLSERLE